MTGPLAALDVDDRDADRLAVAACVLFRGWGDAEAACDRVTVHHGAAPYVPGELYRRELPALLAVLGEVERPSLIVVDGYVWLDAAHTQPGPADAARARGSAVSARTGVSRREAAVTRPIAERRRCSRSRRGGPRP